jgi:exonuclease III
VLALATLNVQATAPARARRLAGWLTDQDQDVWVLTETTAGPGTTLVADHLAAAGYQVLRPPPDAGRGVVLATRIGHTVRDDIRSQLSLPGRVAAVDLATEPAVLVIGVYVPSSDRAPDKLRRKQTFVASLLDTIASLTDAERARTVLCGDLNVIPRDHQPAYRGFLPFEYAMLDTFATLGLVDAHTRLHPNATAHSWIGRTGNGYRFDYVLTASALAPRVWTCRYDHETRTLRLSDHAAVTATLDVHTARRRPTPATRREMPRAAASRRSA